MSVFLCNKTVTTSVSYEDARWLYWGFSRFSSIPHLGSALNLATTVFFYGFSNSIMYNHPTIRYNICSCKTSLNNRISCLIPTNCISTNIFLPIIFNWNRQNCISYVFEFGWSKSVAKLITKIMNVCTSQKIKWCVLCKQAYGWFVSSFIILVPASRITRCRIKECVY